MSRLHIPIPLGLLVLLVWPGYLFADYTLVLKNGRRIAVESYREEGGMIKFQGLGGEIGISRDQIQTIVKGGVNETQGLRLPSAAEPLSQPARTSQEEKTAASPGPGTNLGEKTLSSEEQRAREENEYRNKVLKITEELRAAMERYSLTRGASSRDPSLLDTEEAIRARTEDLNSRLRDAQYNPAGPSDAGAVRLSTPSPFTGAPPTTTELQPGGVIPRVDSPPPAYSERERELSELRNRINQLTKEREKLIEEMRQKNFNTGSLFIQ
ncbi:MAG TPA: hypothetical protein VGR30_02255 [Candidatus Binatia bacterium]|jgi:hypothetical protein|nr:hypothetical protein [Candidatus Binatia bacterium]